MSKGRYFCGGSALAVTLVLSFSASQASAQAAQATPPAAQPAEVSEVVATGSYIRGAPEDAAIPVEVTTRADLQQEGEPTLTQMVRGLSEIGNTLQGDAARSGGNVGETTLNLRNLGSNRTLNLMNGIRINSEVTGGTTNGDSQNIGQIPINAVVQVEQLKQGGAATYGSAAVAGVVNFRTRTDLNGLEAGASYQYIHGGAGDYSGDVQWGRRKDNNNILIDFSYSQVGQLRANARDFTKQGMLLGASGTGVGAGYSAIGNPGTYAFAGPAGITVGTGTNAGVVTVTTIAPNATTMIDPTTGRAILATSSSGAGSTGGEVRDPLCNQLGGLRTFAATTGTVVNPACVTNFNQAENLINQTNRYDLFIDSNFDITDNWRVNASVNFSKTVVPHSLVSGIDGGGTLAPCDPYDNSITSGSTGLAQNCVGQGGGASQAAQNYYVSGYNPAVYDFVSKASTNAGIAAGGIPTSGNSAVQNHYFSAADINNIASCLPGQNTTYCAGINGVTFDPLLKNPDAPGTVVLNPRLWQPFGMGGIGQNDPLFYQGELSNRFENTYFRTQDSLKGSLGTIFGTDIDMTLQGAYTHHFNDVRGKGILIDRLQRALNGFATDLDDHTGPSNTIDRCTAADTYGQRPGAYSTTVAANPTNLAAGTTTSTTGVITTVGTQTITTQTPVSTPYAVGAGGGWDPTTGVTGAGDGCYFFNPFASAVTQIRYGGGTAVAGNATTYGFINTGVYQGYAPVNGVFTTASLAAGAPTGVGLTNSNGIINWLTENRWSHLTQDALDLQLVFNGTGGVNLKGGPIAWAAGGEFRYDRREQTYDVLSNRLINPCSFITNVNGTAYVGPASGLLTDDLNVVGKNAIPGGNENYSATCNELTNTPTVASLNTGNMTGVWTDGFGGVPYVREERDVAGFGELDLPFTDKFKMTASSRYERDRINTFAPAAAVVNAFNASYQLASSYTLRGSLGQTFQDIDCGLNGSVCLPGLNSSTVQGPGGSIIGSSATTNPLLGAGLINQADRIDVYGNTTLTPERGSNFSFGMVYHPTPGLLATLDLVNIKIVGTRIAPTGSAIPKILVGETGVTDTVLNSDVTKNICTPSNAGLFVPGATSTSTNNLPLVQLLQTSGAGAGNTVSACATGNTNNVTLSGITTANGTGGTVANASYALLFSVPNYVNAGTTWTRQLDEHLEYTFPRQMLGGTVQGELDGTYILFFNQDPGQFGGVTLGAPAKYKGVYSSNNAAETPSPFRGTIGLTWKSGKNTVHVQSHWASSVADGSLGVPIPATSSSPGTNYNPVPSLSNNCTQSIVNTLAPDPRMTNKVAGLVGVPGVGEEAINFSCNVGNFTGDVVPGWVTTDVTYIRQLPGKTTLSFSIANLFDKDPPFQKLQPYYYAPYGTGNGLGREVKVSLHKAF
jgi:hypothetical protein